MLVALLFLMGLAVISAGVGMIYLPAGIIAAGVGLMALSIILSRGGVPDTQQHPLGPKPLDNNKKNTGGIK